MKWKIKNGKIIDIKEMGNSHLNNSINYLKKRMEWWKNNQCEYYSAITNNETTKMCVKSEIRQNEDIYNKMAKGLEKLEIEKKKREKINIK